MPICIHIFIYSCLFDSIIYIAIVVFFVIFIVFKGSVVPPDMVIPPFSVVAGCPARIIGSQCESTTIVAISHVEGLFKSIEVVS